VTLSVVIATKDRAAYLRRALEALALQEDAPDFEVVVADNGSSDDTPSVVEELAQRVPYRLRRMEAGTSNRALARNVGIRAAQGELVLFVDDDVWLPAHFLAAHAAAHRGTRRRAVTGPIINVPSYDRRPRPTAAHFSNAFFCTCNASVPRSALEASGGFDESFDLYGWEDTELGLRLRAVGLEHVFAWEAYLYHIKPPEPLQLAVDRAIEKATMAARLVRKNPTLRTRLATGAYGLNLVRGRFVAPFLPIYTGIARSTRLPRPLVAYARARLLDGVYVERLSRELAKREHTAG
jgi:glycosyltransferase involved in cell wall biosynthesis